MASEGHTPSKGRASSVSETASKRSAERSTSPVPREKEPPSSSRFRSQTGSPQALSLVHSCPVRVKLPDIARNYAKAKSRKRGLHFIDDHELGPVEAPVVAQQSPPGHG